MAGPEIAVATTKAYSTQLVATYALAIQFAKVREEISEERYVELIKEVKTLPEKIAKILEDLGTFQISDLTYNTLGGAVGGVIYYLGYSRKRKK